jgi:undecaprenyl-diphosphatase
MNRIPVLTVRSFFWIGLTALAFGVFIDITKDMLEGEVGFLDQSILLAIGKIRAPWMTVAAVDLTALGSVTLVCLFSAFTVITLLMLHDKAGTLQLLSALGGASLWTALTKHTIERTRPEVIPHLVEVSGYSYPSGHSLVAASAYMTIAILACRYLHSARARIAILSMAALMIVLVGLSRAYLGVHYPTDVASGIALGGAWAFVLAGVFSLKGRTPNV